MLLNVTCNDISVIYVTAHRCVVRDSLPLYPLFISAVCADIKSGYRGRESRTNRCAGGLKKLSLQSGSQRQRHFVGFFNVPVQAPTRGHPFIRLFRETAPFSRLLRHAGDTEDTFFDLTPMGPHGSQLK